MLSARNLALLSSLAVLAAIPFVVKVYQLDIVIFLMINIILVTSYRFNTLTGEWSLIHVVMMGVGAYASALFAKKFGLSFWVSMPAAAVFTAFVAYILCFPLFRMKGFYFLIGSFAAGEAIRLSWDRFRIPFGGPKGIKYIPSPTVGDIDLGHPVYYYYLTAVVMLLCLLVMYRLEKSRIGFTLHAIHWKDVLAESVGVDARKYRSIAFIVASFFAAIAGALLGHYIGTINPNRFSLGIMLAVLVWTIVGGTGTFTGPIIGVVLLTVSDEFLRSLEEVRPMIYGVILILTIRFLPNGIEDLLPRVKAFIAGRRKARPEG